MCGLLPATSWEPSYGLVDTVLTLQPTLVSFSVAGISAWTAASAFVKVLAVGGGGGGGGNDGPVGGGGGSGAFAWAQPDFDSGQVYSIGVGAVSGVEIHLRRAQREWRSWWQQRRWQWWKCRNIAMQRRRRWRRRLVGVFSGNTFLLRRWRSWRRRQQRRDRQQCSSARRWKSAEWKYGQQQWGQVRIIAETAAAVEAAVEGIGAAMADQFNQQRLGQWRRNFWLMELRQSMDRKCRRN